MPDDAEDDASTAGVSLRRINQDFNRAEDLRFRSTFFPWNEKQRPKVLDLFLRADGRERIFTTTITTDMEAAFATGHVPLRCTIALRSRRTDDDAVGAHDD